MRKLIFRTITSLAQDSSLEVAQWRLQSPAASCKGSAPHCWTTPPLNISRAGFLVQTQESYYNSTAISGWGAIRRSCNSWMPSLKSKHLLLKSKFVSMAEASQRKLLFQSPWMKQCSWANKGWALKHFPLVENNFSWNILTLKRKFLCKKLQEMQVQLWHTPNKAFKKANFLSKSYSFPLSHSHITQGQGNSARIQVIDLLCIGEHQSQNGGEGGSKNVNKKKHLFLLKYTSVGFVLTIKIQKLLKWHQSSHFPPVLRWALLSLSQRQFHDYNKESLFLRYPC